MYRRDFLASMLAAAVAPAFVPVDRIMRIKPIVLPPAPVVHRADGSINFYDASGRLLAEIPMNVGQASAGGVVLSHAGDSGYVVATGVAAEMRYVRSDGQVMFTDNHIPLTTNCLIHGSTIWFPGGMHIGSNIADNLGDELAGEMHGVLAKSLIYSVA